MLLDLQNPLGTLEECRRILYERDLAKFIAAAWPVLEPGRKFVSNWHIDAIAEHLTAAMNGQIRNLLINIPPRHMKSLSVCVFWPCWVWAQNTEGLSPEESNGKGPNTRWLFSSYKQELSTRDSLKCRRLIQSNWYQKLWGDRFCFVDDQNQKTRFENDKSGYRLSTTSGTGVGEGGDYVICVPGDTLITTDKGQIPIREIVENKLPVKVLGASGAWQTIEKYEKNPGKNRPLIEFTFSNGDKLQCTGNHPLYVNVVGYVPASQIKTWVLDPPRLRIPVAKPNFVALSPSPAMGNPAIRATENVTITEIDDLEPVETVYNLRVSPEHCYYANSILTHNCDDPHDLENALSDTMREATLRWWDETMSTRLNDMKTGRKIIVMQRLHERDLSGHVLKQGGYVHLCLPAEYEPQRACVIGGWRDPRKEQGELLWPAHVPRPEIEDLKIRLGPSAYAGQFLQRPAPPGGATFKLDWFRYYRREGNFYHLLDKAGNVTKTYSISDCQRFVAMDPAGTKKEDNNKACYTVMQAWGVTPEFDMLLLGQYREMRETPDITDDATNFARRWEVDFILVEKDGIGLGIFQTLSKRAIPVIAAKAHGLGDKLQRAQAAQIRMAAGKVYFEENAPYLFELHNELEHFPNSEYADQTDCLSWSARQVTDMGNAVEAESDKQAPPMPAPQLTGAGRYRRNF